MRVCLDVQAAVASGGGVGRYVRELLERLPRFRGSDELATFHFALPGRAKTVIRAGEGSRVVRFPRRLVQAAWRGLGWPPFDRFSGSFDVFHFPNFLRPPLRRGASVVTVHDLSFLRVPETLEARNLRHLKSGIGDTVRRADAIVANSAFTAREAVELLGADPGRTVAVPLGISERFRPPPPAEIAEVKRRLALDGPYLLHVGTLEPRKNHELLLGAFERLVRFDGLLVLAGRSGWNDAGIRRRLADSSRRDRIRWLPALADADLPALYAGAAAFVFPSRYEGFGFPPLEALACGAPVVAARNSALLETLEGVALLVDGFDPSEWAARLEDALSSPERGGAGARGAARAAQFSWNDTARRTWDVYRNVARGAPPGGGAGSLASGQEPPVTPAR